MFSGASGQEMLFLPEGFAALRFAGSGGAAPGQATPPGRGAMAHVPQERSMRLFADLSGLIASQVHGSDMLPGALSQNWMAKSAGLQRLIALYAPAGSTAYGIARMFEGYCAGLEALDTRVFVEPDLALGWLGLDMAYADLQQRQDWAKP